MALEQAIVFFAVFAYWFFRFLAEEERREDVDPPRWWRRLRVEPPRAPKPSGRRADYPHDARSCSWTERRTSNPRVAGSNPAGRIGVAVGAA